MIKCRDKALTSKSINRLSSILQVVPVLRRVEKKALRFVDKMTSKLKEGPAEENEGINKVRLHALKTLFLLSNESSPRHLYSARTSNLTKEE